MLRKEIAKRSPTAIDPQGTPPMRIGIDFDNTLINYDAVFCKAAQERGLIGADFRETTKQAVRDAIRLLPDGEMSWQRLQGFIYSRRIADATMFDGVDRFLRRARAAGHGIVIVSHKTEFGHLDPERINLRQAALDWMERHGFFCQQGFGMKRENVHFESTRAEKLARITRLQCTHFIDDLEEVLEDEGFPSVVKRILFASSRLSLEAARYPVCPTWQDVETAVFGERA